MPTSDLARPACPPAIRLDLVEQLHGQDVADPYRWLEDTDDPQTKAWSSAEDELYASVRATWPSTTELTVYVRSRLGFTVTVTGDDYIPLPPARLSAGHPLRPG